jgi:hypothetical protein
MKTVLGDFSVKLGKSPIYIQHVEGAACGTVQMIMEKEW